MGTTRIKVIDLSSDQKEIKTARKHARLDSLAKRAEKLTQTAKLKGAKGREGQEGQISVKPATIENTEKQEIEAEKTGGEESAELVQSNKPKELTRSTASSAVAKKSQHQRGKKYLDAQTQIDRNKSYSVDEALSTLPKVSYAKFDPTVEIHISVTEKNMKGSVNLPHPFGEKKQKKILIFSDKRSAIDDKQIVWGDEKTIEQIEKGMLKPSKDFDIVYAAPKFMPQLAKVAKVLGPAGMMPNPKNGTISDDPKNALAAGQDTSFEYRTEPTAPVIHTKVGKLSAKPEALKENLSAIILAIGPAKITKAILKSTMSPPLKLDIPSTGK